MQNFNTALDATSTAYHSAGSAMKENEAYMQSIEAKLKLIEASFQKLVNGNGGIAKFIKLILDATNTLLEFADTGVGTVTLGLNALALSVAGVSKVLGTTGLTAIVAKLTQGIAALSVAEKSCLIIAAASAVAFGIYAIAKAFGDLEDTIGESVEALDDLKEASESATEEVQNTQKELDEIQKKLTEINNEKLRISDRDELRNLTAQTNELELQEAKLRNQLALQLDKEESAKREYEMKAKQNKLSDKYMTFDYEQGYTNKYDAVDITGQGTITESFDTAINAYKNLIAERDKYIKQKEELEASNDAEKEDIEALQKEIDEYTEVIGTLREEMMTTTEAATQIIEAGQDGDGVIQGWLDKWYDLIGLSQEVDETVEAMNDEVEETGDTIEDVSASVTDGLNDMIEAFSTLQSIVDEYNTTGQMTADMVQTLANLSPQYVAALQNENGVLTVNTSLLQAQFEIQKELALINVEVAKQLAITAYCEQTLGEETSNTTSKLQEDEQQAYDLSSAYAQLTDAANRAAAAINRVRAEGKDDEAFYEGLREVQKTFDDMKDAIEQTEISTKDLSKAGKEVSKSHSSAAKKTEDAWKKAFDEEKKALDHMHEMNEISDEEYYNRLLELNEKYFGEASGQHEKYLDEYRKNEETAFKGLQKVYKDRLKKQTDAQLKALKQQKDAALKAIDAEIKGVKKAKDAALKAIDERIKAVKKQKDEAVKAIEAEIKALNKQKEAQHKYFQDKIDALQRAHDLQEQINQLEEYENQLAQAKAQRVWVMKDGQFQLGENEEAVSGAEQQLADYKDDLDYERQLQELQDLQEYWDEYYDNLIEKKEEYKEYIEEYYDQQIEALEEYRDRVEEEYDAQIEALEEYRDQVEEMYDNMIEAYKEHVDAMLEAFDKFNEGNKEKYGTAIEDLKAFVAEWNALIGSMASIDGSLGAATTGFVSGMVSLKGHSAGAAEIGSYASGNGSSVKDDEIALVGESPNTEMLIGSKVNTGVVARLHKGSGVVNAESTKTLAGILNKLGKNKYIGNSSTEGGVTQNFTFGSISLPNVTDANSFVEALRTTFGSYSVQYANAKA